MAAEQGIVEAGRRKQTGKCLQNGSLSRRPIGVGTRLLERSPRPTMRYT